MIHMTNRAILSKEEMSV